MTLTLTIMLMLRLICFGLSAWAIWFSRRGFYAVSRGHTDLEAVFSAAVFFLSAGILAFQVRWLIAAPVGVNILSLVLVNTGLGLLVWAHNRASHKGLLRLSSIIERPDLALALVDLAAANPPAAARLASEARRMTAEAVTRV